MKNSLLPVIILFCIVHLSSAQQWMTSLPIAQDLALAQNKMVFMVWEGATTKPYDVTIINSNGSWSNLDLFTNEEISPIIWEYFVPVIVSETMYEGMYNKIKDNREQAYIDKFNDNSIKILDANGYIVNVSTGFKFRANINAIISNYAINTEFMESELRAYDEEQDFYTAYYLATKYLDFALYSKKNNRSDVADLSQIYLKESIRRLESDTLQNKTALRQRVDLLKCQGDLILKRPVRQVLRALWRQEKKGVEIINESMLAALYFASYTSISKMDDANKWRSKIASRDLKKVQLIINSIKD
jgi:hypothetical protein